MLLAIDIGNTTIHLGVFKEENIIFTFHLDTRIHELADEYAATLLTLFSHRDIKTQDIHGVAMCSVTPPLLGVFKEVCQNYFQNDPLIVDAGAKTGVRILMDNPREVGPDRIVGAAAAYHLYGGPAIIIDLGTATTFDVISGGGDYLGGAISPGVGISAEALFLRTARLPRVELALPSKVIGKNTVSALQSGLIFGYVSLVEGMIDRIGKELGEKPRVIATGGFAPLIAPRTKKIHEANPNLTLMGLKLIYDLNR
jgi:type III pantothenate kinase